MKETITPHGGNLINREIAGDEKAHLDQRVKGLQKIRLDSRQISDVEMIAVGAFSPLEGFIGKEDYHSILHNMRLKDSLPWTIPITLAVIKDEAKSFKEGEDIALQDGEGEILAVLHLEEKYLAEKDQEALQVYGTQDAKHPGVAYLYQSGEVLLGGRISLLRRPKHTQFEKYRFDPKDTRRIFRERGWKRIAGFQTRNPVHRAHEYIQKCALETVDGLLLHPLVGETKADDIPAEVRMQCYEVLLENYYPKDRVFMAVLPAAMRYAGPKEAIFHAIVRKNYGCTHFIVGRDHAGVGDYYGSFDAHYIFDEFSPDELGITPLFFDFTFYCRRCGQMTSNKTCPHLSQDHVSLSGTKVREMLRRGEVPPPEFTRPEIAAVLIEWARAQKEEYHS
ncbi:MAG: Sulfate adenylyltransferase [Actinobacteria bacterium]|nr:Sulfate adenylyltransferase [Actinomycetota bacterium]